MQHSEMVAIVSFRVLPPCVFIDCLLLTIRVVGYLPKDFELKIIESKSKNWTPFVQDAKTHGGFYVIKLCDFQGSFSAVIVGHNLEEQWQELFASFAMVGSPTREGN
jgi:hypothetical protein